MGDITLNVRGDGSEGAAAMREVARGAGDLSDATKKLGASTKAAGEDAKRSIADWKALGEQVMSSLRGIIDFAKESVEAFAEQEKADKQLEMVLGKLSDKFKETASEMQRTLGVSDDMVQRMITLAGRYNMMPAQIEPATRAILDWAAATGGDAEAGMKTLTRSIEFGQDKIKGLGIEFEGTGDKSADLAKAIEALNAKFGGSADTMADTLAGRTSKAKESLGELKETIGGLFDDLDQRTGAVDKTSEAFRNFAATINVARNALSGDFDWGEWLAHGKGGASAPLQHLLGGTRFAKDFGLEGNETEADPLNAIQNPAAKISKTRGNTLGNYGASFLSGASDSQGDEVIRYERKQADDAAREREKEREKQQRIADQWDKADEEREKHNLHAREKAAEDVLKAQEKANEKLLKEAEHADRKEAERAEKAQEKWERREEEKAEKQLRIHEKNQKKIEDQAARFEATMAQAAADAAVAFIGTISDAMSAAFAGDEVDGVEMGLDLLGTVLSIAGMAVGTYFGGAVGAQIGGAVGGGIGQVAKAAYKGSKPKKHDGGIIGVPHYHSGRSDGLVSDEEEAILQRGEIVFSRQQVASNGGAAAVERMRLGRGGGTGGGNHYHVNALDALSFSGFMSAAGGQGIRNTLVTGHGPLPALFGKF